MPGPSTCRERFSSKSWDKLYKRNELATGRFVALGERIDLATVRAPMFLLAARDDELVAPLQLFATERLVGTSAAISKAAVPCRHVGLFMGKTAVDDVWPRIVRWMREPMSIAADSVQVHAIRKIAKNRG